ncbi:anamorsin-like protein [Dinothrombium tinctorium]|uniref:Anamorsin homolog n=1 Tax=Dinothrombium tinctorium TaxID=1965070 RepID=A0A443RKS0_9ACAR|nr:anamorsin-like protein [Dinothrombium tinctorium]
MENKCKNGDKILLLWQNECKTNAVDALRNVVGSDAVINVENCSQLVNSKHETSSFDVAFFGFLGNEKYLSDECLDEVIRVLKPNAALHVKKGTDIDCKTQSFISTLKFSGFVKIDETKDEISAFKPNYEIGSSLKLDQTGPSTDSVKVWQLAAEQEMEGKEAELIDDDELLDPEDLKKPDPASLRVCGTTGKRKACANCTCGLADELNKVEIEQIRQNTQNAKSSCGNCYLGDAFRCASCPYLGMPAFKPGEKVVIDNTSEF